jgi:hypothetical protein
VLTRQDIYTAAAPAMKNQNLRTRSQINVAFPYQIMLNAAECEHDNGKLHRRYLANNGPGRCVVIQSGTRVIYCFKHRDDAERFLDYFGGRRLSALEINGQLWFPFKEI